MSGDNIDNEQITKVPESVRNITNEKVNKLKTKDPKKVAAGKKLAELNKKAKDALAREMKREADPEEKWLPELSFVTVLTVVGIGLTAADLFFRFYRSKKEKDSYDLTPVHMVSELHLSKKLVWVLELEWSKRLLYNS